MVGAFRDACSSSKSLQCVQFLLPTSRLVSSGYCSWIANIEVVILRATTQVTKQSETFINTFVPGRSINIVTNESALSYKSPSLERCSKRDFCILNEQFHPSDEIIATSDTN